jgi:hypothetical protein
VLDSQPVHRIAHKALVKRNYLPNEVKVPFKVFYGDESIAEVD